MDKLFWECPFCNKQLVEKNKYSKSGHLAKCKEWKRYKEETLTKDYLYYNYITLGRSAYDIATEHRLSSAISIINLLKSFKISVRNISEATGHPRCIQKKAQTNMDRYGYAHNFDKNASSRIEWEYRLLEAEGITNVFQRDEVKEKSKQTMMNKYGASHPMHVEEIKSKVLNSRNAVSHRISEPQRKVIQFVENVVANVEVEVYLLNKYVVDILHSTKIIEVFGDYWHANPTLFSPDTIMCYPKGSSYETASDKWAYDYNRLCEIEDAGYQVLIVWEYDINNNMVGVGERLNSFLTKRCEYESCSTEPTFYRKNI